MALSKGAKIFIAIVVVLLFIYFLQSSSTEPTQNQGSLKYPVSDLKYGIKSASGADSRIYPGQSMKGTPKNMNVAKAAPSLTEGTPSIDVNPAEFDSTTSVDDWDNYFTDTNSVIGRSQIRKDNMNFKPLDETCNGYANYAGKVNKVKPRQRKPIDGSFDPDMYDPDNLLPNEFHANWFEVIDEPVSLKGRLLRLDQPLGVDTVGQTLKVPNLDLRAAPPCPKMAVCPWNNSTVEPDYNIKSLC